ncbi:GGDEF domain-containing protein [Pseudomonas poae]|uniref:diguanylate cyclase n=1 Tax=Pseudomonas poae TaxID=200451 RepID=A0A2S9E9G6_9PSED|nr:GGDEF domain-containing protein [Pseudomonas poae]PRA23001.1 GGDEF domain-containing protein [Pseudomonas poae]PRC11521.1 GGDEF domain-containing protein [Pseudomonas poae]
MFKTIETEVLKVHPSPALQLEFAQHDFERLKPFCLLIYIASICIWLVFDLIVSFPGGQGFTGLSMLFLALLTLNTIALGFTRNAQYFQWINLLFVLVIALGTRLLIEALPVDLHPSWLILAASSILYSASVLPLKHWSFATTMVITWVLLNPFYRTHLSLLEVRGALVIFYATFLTFITLYSFLKLRQAKLHNFIMAKLLLDQAYLDTLTEIPNRRAFITSAGKKLNQLPKAHDHYLAMIDIDNFKKVNDVYGHDIGDEVLKRVAQNIKGVMAEFDYARLGGEEFGIYMAGVRHDDVEQLATLLCRRVREEPTQHPVTISIGLTRVEDGETLNQALIKADQALYVSKHAGKDRFTFHGS